MLALYLSLTFCTLFRIASRLLLEKKADFLLGLSLLFCYVWRLILFYSGPEVIKLFSCSTQLSMKFSPLINVKMPTIVGILIYMSGKNNILGLTER